MLGIFALNHKLNVISYKHDLFDIKAIKLKVFYVLEIFHIIFCTNFIIVDYVAFFYNTFEKQNQETDSWLFAKLFYQNNRIIDLNTVTLFFYVRTLD